MKRPSHRASILRRIGVTAALASLLPCTGGWGGPIWADEPAPAEAKPADVALAVDDDAADSSFHVDDARPLSRLWFRGEYLLWWTKGNPIPPLLTTAPAGTDRDLAGVLGEPGTQIVFGDQALETPQRSGARFHTGYWLDDAASTGLELDLFGLGNGANTTFATPFSDGSPIYARPIINAATGLEDTQLVAYPGLVDGQFATRTASELYSAALSLRSTWRAGDRGRIDLVGGYRYCEFRESLSVTEHLVSTAISPVILPGTVVDVADEFDTKNVFQGGELGFNAVVGQGPLTLDLLAKIALGNLQQRIEVQGATQVTKPGDLPVDKVGGLLALPSNMGVRRHNDFAVLPELGANVHWALTPRLSLTGGYSFLLLNQVARTGAQIDRQIDPSQLSPLLNVPPAGGTGAVHPTVPFQTSTFWAQGISLGLQWNY